MGSEQLRISRMMQVTRAKMSGEFREHQYKSFSQKHDDGVYLHGVHASKSNIHEIQVLTGGLLVNWCKVYG